MINANSFKKDEFVVFFYRQRLRSGDVDKVGQTAVTLKLDEPNPGEPAYKSFRYEGISNLVKKATSSQKGNVS